MSKQGVRKYIDEQIKKHSKDIDKINAILEIYIEGCTSNCEFEIANIEDLLEIYSQEQINQIKKVMEDKKEALKEFKTIPIEILKNNEYGFDEEDIKTVIEFYKIAIILHETCVQTNLRIQGLELLEKELNLK